MLRRLMLGILSLSFLLAGLNAQTARTVTLPQFAGTWVLKYEGSVFLILNLQMQGKDLVGSLLAPRSYSYDQDGDFSKVSATQRKAAIDLCTLKDGRLEVFAAEDKYLMTLVDAEHATMVAAEDEHPGKPWKLQRSHDKNVAITWTPDPASPDIANLRAELRAMVKEDQAVRTGATVSEPELARVDSKNRAAMLRIYEQYRWPRKSVVGKEAEENFALLTQHQELRIQEQFLPDLERAVKDGEAPETHYAYLFDRVQFGQGKPQHWGTQGQCEDGKPVLYRVDDMAGLEKRRKELGMQPVSEYLKLMDDWCRKVIGK